MWPKTGQQSAARNGKEISKRRGLVLFGMRAVGVDDSREDCVRVMAHDILLQDGDHFLEGDYLVGADG